MFNTKRIIALLTSFVLVFSCCYVKAEEDGEEGLLSKPEIYNVTFQENKKAKNFLMVITGRNFEQFANDSTVKVYVTGPDNKELNVSSDIEYVVFDHMAVRLDEDTKSGNIRVEIKYKKEIVESDPFYVDVPAPEIYFVYGKDGILPGKEVEIHGKNFSGLFVDTEISLSGLKNYKITDNLISFKLPRLKYQKDIEIIRDGLKSNELKMSKIFPPIIQNISVEKGVSDDNKDLFKIVAENIPNDTKKVKVKFNNKSVTPEQIYENHYGKIIIEAEAPKPLPPLSLIKVVVDKTESNILVYEKSDPVEITNIEYISDKRQEKILDIFANNLPTNEDDIEIKIGGKKIGQDEFSTVYNKIRINTENDIKTKGEILITAYEKYQSNPFEYDLEENLEPRIYKIEDKYGFHEGTPFTIYGSGFGNDTSDIKLSVSGAKLDKNIGLDGVKLSGGKIEAGFLLPEDSTDVELSEEPSKVVKIYVQRGKNKSNVLEVPFGSDHPTAVYAAPMIKKVLFPEGKVRGKKVEIYGYNFPTNIKHNVVTLNKSELTVTDVDSRGKKITAILPEDAKSGSLRVKATYPEEKISEGFDLEIAPSDSAYLEFSFQKLETEEKTAIIEEKQEELVLANLNIKNFVSNLAIQQMELELNFEEGDPESEFAIDKLKIAPFSEIYLKKGSKEVAGPAFIRTTKNIVYLSFPPFEMPLTEDEEGDEYKIEGNLLPFLTDNSKISLSFDPKNNNQFAVRALDFGNNNGVIIKNKSKINSETVEIRNPTIFCINGQGEDGENGVDYCKSIVVNQLGDVSIDEDLLQKTGGNSENENDNSNDNQNEENNAEEGYTTSEDDLDGDGLSNIEEHFLGTDEENIDSDNDGHDDNEEIKNGSSPIKRGTSQIFSDLKDAEWATEYIIKLKLFGVIKDNKKFYPNKAITRGDFLQMAVDALREEALPTVSQNPFIDIPTNHELAPYAQFAKNKNAIKGYNDGTLRPENNITRAEALKILLTIKGLKGSKKKSDFKDLDSWQITWVEKAKELGIVKGFSDTEFKPNDNLTRAQATKIIYGLIWN